MDAKHEIEGCARHGHPTQFCECDMNAAVAAERERCARVAESRYLCPDYPDSCEDTRVYGGRCHMDVGVEIAAKIRKEDSSGE